MFRLQVLLLLLVFFWSSCQKLDPIDVAIQEISFPYDMPIEAMAVKGNILMVAGGQGFDQGFIAISEDNGMAWQDTILTGGAIYDVAIHAQLDTLYATGIAGIYWVRRGKEWEKVQPRAYGIFRAIDFNLAGNGILAEGGTFGSGSIIPTRDYWRSDSTQVLDHSIEDIRFLDEQRVMACGYGHVLSSTDRGYSWNNLDVPNDFYVDMAFPDTLSGYIIGEGGTLLSSQDGGASWQRLRKGGQVGTNYKGFKAVAFSSALNGWIAGDDGLLWNTTDGGLHWSAVESLPKGLDFSAMVVQGNTAWVGTRQGRLFKLTQ